MRNLATVAVISALLGALAARRRRRSHRAADLPLPDPTGLGIWRYDWRRLRDLTGPVPPATIPSVGPVPPGAVPAPAAHAGSRRRSASDASAGVAVSRGPQLREIVEPAEWSAPLYMKREAYRRAISALGISPESIDVLDLDRALWEAGWRLIRRASDPPRPGPRAETPGPLMWP